MGWTGWTRFSTNSLIDNPFFFRFLMVSLPVRRMIFLPPRRSPGPHQQGSRCFRNRDFGRSFVVMDNNSRGQGMREGNPVKRVHGLVSKRRNRRCKQSHPGRYLPSILPQSPSRANPQQNAKIMNQPIHHKASASSTQVSPKAEYDTWTHEIGTPRLLGIMGSIDMSSSCFNLY